MVVLQLFVFFFNCFFIWHHLDLYVLSPRFLGELEYRLNKLTLSYWLVKIIMHIIKWEIRVREITLKALHKFLHVRKTCRSNLKNKSLDIHLVANCLLMNNNLNWKEIYEIIKDNHNDNEILDFGVRNK